MTTSILKCAISGRWRLHPLVPPPQTWSGNLAPALLSAYAPATNALRLGIHVAMLFTLFSPLAPHITRKSTPDFLAGLLLGHLGEEYLCAVAVDYGVAFENLHKEEWKRVVTSGHSAGTTR